ncbi:MAG: hypothetical protein PHP44_14655, partial [Kiritimatiellae bacterium]|nr:hypothetical protein [Kiritimatiellia bacterium]
ATLRGHAQINGAVTNAGTIRPGGDDPGQINVSGAVVMQSSSLLVLDMDGTEAGTEFDYIETDNAMTLAGDLQIDLAEAFEETVGEQDEYVLIQAGDVIQGAFDNYASGAAVTLGTNTFYIHYGESAVNSSQVYLDKNPYSQWVWGGDADNAYWDDPLNWESETVPYSGDTTDILFHGGLQTMNTNDVASPFHVRQLWIGDDSSPFVLGGAGISVYDAIISLSDQQQMITSSVTLLAPVFVYNNEGGSLVFGDMDRGTYETTIMTDGPVTIEGSLSGSGNLFKTGDGLLTIVGDGDNSGTITVSNGLLMVQGELSSAPVVVTNAGLRGSGQVGALTVKGGSVVRPGNSATTPDALLCSGLVLEDGVRLELPVTSDASATNASIQVSGSMTKPAAADAITVELSYVGDKTNYFRNITFIRFSSGSHSPAHTNWVIEGVPENLMPYMTVKYTNDAGDDIYYVQGATPNSDITNGVPNAANDLEVRIYATTVEGISYDLIYYDAVSWPSGTAASNITWTKHYSTTATVSTTVFTNNLSSLNAANLRFLRVSPMGAWQNETDKFASRQVYVAKKAILWPGRNWVAMPGAPVNPTVSNVFGYNLPAGVDSAHGTKVELYSQGGSITPTGAFWRGSASGLWQWSQGGSGAADEFELPIDQGFLVNLPGSVSRNLALVGALRTNTPTITISGNQAYTFVSMQLPGNMHPKDMNLLESGFSGNARGISRYSDKIFLWDRENQGIADDGKFLWYNVPMSAWYYGSASVNDPVGASERPIGQDDALLIYRHGTAGFTWTNKIYYTPPTASMDP